MTGRAGYRFVPFGNKNKVVKPPVAFDDLKLDTPHPDGSVSGMLEVVWKAETPVCIGTKEEDQHVEPFEIDGRGCLPGASLRGMLRSVMEIAGFCHLGPINDHRHFGFRNFNDAENYRSRVQADKIKAGWLTYGGGGWILTVAFPRGAQFPIDFDSILNRIKNPVDADAWRKMPVHDKRKLMSKSAPELLAQVNFKMGSNYFGDVRRGKFWKKDSDSYPDQIRGYLVVGGTATDPKANRANEVFVGAPSPAKKDKHSLHEGFMDIFNRINANPGRDSPEPTGAWRYWLGQKASEADLATPRPEDPAPVNGCGLPGIPVFFCGDPITASSDTDYDPKTSDFVMGLSRVIKIPYREGVGDVAARLYGQERPYRVPELREEFDFARAIFGWLDERRDGDDKQTNALAGRVTFSPAFSELQPKKTEPKDFVFGAPRESFHPFYLEGDYHSGGKPVGRKRYPVRSTPNKHSIASENAATKSRVVFHAPSTTYKGRIRIHNLHPIELAAFVWCLTFGKKDGPWYHAIGRAKGYGYGRLHLDHLAWARAPRTVGVAETNDWDGLANRFETWMTERLGYDFAETETIQRLRAYVNPKMGDRYKQNLAYPPVEGFKTIQGPIDRGEDWRSR